MDSIWIGIDLGTTSTKAVAFTAAGKVAGRSSIPTGINSPLPGYAEQDPEKICTSVYDSLATLLRSLPSGASVEAVAFSCAMHSVILLDHHDRPLTPAILWADRRSSEQASYIRSLPASQAIYRVTGTPIHPMTPLCKLVWFAQNTPQLLEQAARIVSIKSYVLHAFTGQWIEDYSLASATGLMDIAHKSWYQPALDLAMVPVSKLPDLVPPDQLLGPLSAEVIRATGLPEQVRLIPGGSDGCLANLGSGALKEGEAALSIGTSAAIRVASKKPVADPRGRLFSYYLDDHTAIVGGPSNNGAVVLDWFHRKIIHAFQADIPSLVTFLQDHDHTLGAIPPGCQGLMCLPYLFGERAPVWEATARGAFIGLQADHDGYSMIRSIMEGITLNLVQIGQLVTNQTGSFKKIYASGGFVRSKTWIQMVADMFGLPVEADRSGDQAALGAVLMAHRATGAAIEPSHFRETEDKIIVRPNPNAHHTYQQLIAVYQRLYDQLSSTMDTLRTID